LPSIANQLQVVGFSPLTGEAGFALPQSGENDIRKRVWLFNFQGAKVEW